MLSVMPRTLAIALGILLLLNMGDTIKSVSSGDLALFALAAAKVIPMASGIVTNIFTVSNSIPAIKRLEKFIESGSF